MNIAEFSHITIPETMYIKPPLVIEGEKIKKFYITVAETDEISLTLLMQKLNAKGFDLSNKEHCVIIFNEEIKRLNKDNELQTLFNQLEKEKRLYKIFVKEIIMEYEPYKNN